MPEQPGADQHPPGQEEGPGHGQQVEALARLDVAGEDVDTGGEELRRLGIGVVPGLGAVGQEGVRPGEVVVALLQGVPAHAQRPGDPLVIAVPVPGPVVHIAGQQQAQGQDPQAQDQDGPQGLPGPALEQPADHSGPQNSGGQVEGADRDPYQEQQGGQGQREEDDIQQEQT